MRLIGTTTLAMKTHIGRDIPPYAILSHTWEDEEVTLQDWNSPTRDGLKGFHKIRMTCQLAASDGIEYAWVDTCCIDKTNSAELSEAINSMYKWYKNAKVCYVYLSDLRLPAPAPDATLAIDLGSFLRGCRWFSRGWTLQELIAPNAVLFYQRDWRLVGNKEQWNYILSGVTGISCQALWHYVPTTYSIAERMSWAAGRETTREEDKAYCLLGIFDVNMPMLYGEGAKSFRRLQEEIIRSGYDVSIFAWTKTFPDDGRVGRKVCPSGAFANDPGDFYSIPAQRLVTSQGNEVSITNAGVKLTLELCLVNMAWTDRLSYVLPIRDYEWFGEGQNASALGVTLKKIGLRRFVRTDPDKLVVIPGQGQAGKGRRIRCPDAYILTNIPSEKPMDFFQKYLYPSNFTFPRGCRVVKAWPSDKWNDAENLFMTFDKEEYGSLLLDVRVPTPTENDDGRSGEFMFLFGGRLNSTDIKHDPHDLQYTIVGYREHQVSLDIINLRIEAGDIDVKEMRRTLRNFAIPRQRTAAVPVDESGQYIYTSVDSNTAIYDEWENIPEGDKYFRDELFPHGFHKGDGYQFTSSSVAFENEQTPWRV